MKALSLKQPWASLVAIEAKTIETRSWFTNYRGPVAIHASRSWTWTQRHICDRPEFRNALRCCQALPLGCIICIAELVDCTVITRETIPPEPENLFGDYRPGRYAWRLANIRRLGPALSAPGKLGLWEWTIPVIYQEQITRTLGTA